MNRIRLFLSALTLIFSLASCAPSITGPGGQALRVVRGEAFASARTVPLAELNAQTPANSYVTFPDCSGAAVLVADVRQFGPEMTDTGCKQAASSAGLNAGSVILIGAGGAALGIVVFLALVRLYISRIP